MNDAPWAVVQVVANHEKKVAQHLAVRSLEHYLPLYAERSRWTDRTVTLERPLFPGYIFVRYSPGERVSVLSTPGIFRVLGNPRADLHSGMVNDEEVARIREGLNGGCILRPHPQVAVGTRVRVRQGVFQDVEGLVTELRGKCNVVLTLANVERFFSLQVDLNDIEVLRPLNERDRIAVGKHAAGPRYAL
ncbi:MAG: hypothetical protein KGN79_01495 [Acidobacteriota bacterium]|nr:hypothetical protein [Acidobacteriota bacterium]